MKEHSRIKSFEDYQEKYRQSVASPEQFWEEIADEFTWKKKWDKVLTFDFKKPEIKWFQGATLNITENCLDRHLKEHGEDTAIIWEANATDEPSIRLTYRQLHSKVCQLANVLKQRGLKKGDVVCIYMPMVPELAIALLACARIGAIHSVVFAGFSSKALTDRINDAKAKMVLTSDGSFRGSKTFPLKNIVDEALKSCPSIQHVLVLERTGDRIDMLKGRDFWWHEELQNVDDVCAAEPMDAEDMLFILYTSGSTGQPKGMVHTCAGYMVYTNYTFNNVFQYNKGDVYWCTADIGWVTGHSYIVYGPLSAGATTMMFEGTPSYPDMGRFWQTIEKHRVNIFYTAPTAIRSLMKSDIAMVESYDLSSLKVLGTVGEPINAEAWHWYDDHIGKNKCPIVDTWWQTETGGIMISPLAGITKTKPTFATLPLPGIQPVLIDESGAVVEGNGVEGKLAIRFPWPSIARTVYGDHARYKDTYFSAFPGYYFSGDGCRRDAEGFYRITGRVDDVIIVSGHNLGTAEIENAIDEHPDVIECAVVGYPHDVKGQGIYAYINCKDHEKGDEEIRQEIIDYVSENIGKIAKPEKIQFVNGLPKTRSGKIMRRILRKVAEGNISDLGDTSTLLDPQVVDEIIEGAL